mgnify:CR=1 FL=1
MRMMLLVAAFVTLTRLPLFGQETEPWKGFEKVKFEFMGRSAWYIKPAIPLDGNPWVWRAHFPDWHTDMDSILVARGYHIAYINTNGLFGHPSALLIWDKFYEYLTREHGFASKVALEAVSRGGLYAYGWAKRNPARVSCIYAEAPVCDPRSWPGGKWKGLGSPEDWKKWLELYGLTEEEAAGFSDIPLNDLEGLASFKVPILHVVGPHDKVVPNDENTWPLIQNYMKAGGPATVYTLSRGEQKLNGHHFTIEDPQLFADFIHRHSYPVRKVLLPENYIEVNGGLSRSMSRFETRKKGTVAFLGGSITHNPGWRTKTIQYLREKYPDTEFSFISAGIPSLGSTPHAFRFSTDVLSQGIPDLLFVESAVNDRTNGFSEQAQIRALEGIFRHALTVNPEMDIVLMAFADPDKNDDWDKGVEPVEVQVHQKIASHYRMPFINLAREIYDKMKIGEISWEYDFKDLHPSPFGQELYFEAIKTLFNQNHSEVNTRNLPAPLDVHSYVNGQYLSPSSASKLNGFTYIENWKPTDGKGTRKGFTEVPMLVAETDGATFELEFTGRAIGIAVVSGPDAGVISYQIDGKKPRQLNLFTQWSNQLHLPWYLMLDDELKSGKHRLKVTLLPKAGGGTQGNACRIVHFLLGK